MLTTNFNLTEGYFAAKFLSADSFAVVGKVEDILQAVKKAKRIFRETKGQVNSIRLTIPYDVFEFSFDADLINLQASYAYDENDAEDVMEQEAIGNANLIIKSSSGFIYFFFTVSGHNVDFRQRTTASFTIPILKSGDVDERVLVSVHMNDM